MEDRQRDGKRKSVSPRRRFELFKRDGFRCLYCGRTPPAVVLHADHILPIVEGGTDDMLNLVTACLECNLGKGARLLTDKPAALSTSQEAERDRFDQLREYNDWLSERAVVKESWFQQVSTVWITLDRSDPCEWVISGQRASTVRMFLDRLPAQEIIDALHTRMRVIQTVAINPTSLNIFAVSAGRRSRSSIPRANFRSQGSGSASGRELAFDTNFCLNARSERRVGLRPTLAHLANCSTFSSSYFSTKTPRTSMSEARGWLSSSPT